MEHMNAPIKSLTNRLRFPQSSRFKITDEFKTFARSYIPNFSPTQWLFFRQVLIDLFIFVEQGKVKGETLRVCARPLIDVRKGAEVRIYLTPEAHTVLTKFPEPAEVLEVAYRFKQQGKELGTALHAGKLAQKRDEILLAGFGGVK
jgi:hypothetical protein